MLTMNRVLYEQGALRKGLIIATFIEWLKTATLKNS